MSLTHHRDLSDNAFSGSVPESYGKLGNLNYLDLSGNTLEGQLPATFAALQNLKHVNLEGNLLCGCWPFPANLTLVEWCC